MKILLVEDNEMIIKAISFLLTEHQFHVDIANNINTAKEMLNKTYDLIILDLMLPDGDGLDFFKDYVNAPTLVLSAKDDEDDVVKAIDLGVQDYIIKPFRSKELLSRINNIIKRNTKETVKTYNDLVFDLNAYKVYKNNKEVDLTSLELKILFFLLENCNMIVTRDAIIEQIWDSSLKFVNDNTLSVYIKRIRKKLESKTLIKTIKGIGYRVDL